MLTTSSSKHRFKKFNNRKVKQMELPIMINLIPIRKNWRQFNLNQQTKIMLQMTSILMLKLNLPQDYHTLA